MRDGKGRLRLAWNEGGADPGYCSDWGCWNFEFIFNGRERDYSKWLELGLS
jgi:hypothetical protein